jgi:hypothetical protein
LNVPQTHRPGWIFTAILAGAAYFVVGRVFAWPTTHAQAWRLAAWIASGVIFAAHIAYEQLTRHRSPRTSALHTAAAVAIGALALAVAGAMYSIARGASPLSSWLLAFVLWPAFTALPAFLVALTVSSTLARIQRSRSTQRT